jgi:hypothetical protein
MHVQIEGGEGDGLALGHLRWGQLRLRRGGILGDRLGFESWGFGDGLAVFVDGAGEDDLALSLTLVRLIGWGRGGGLSFAGVEGQREQNQRKTGDESG